jgi:hypothetical protein
MDRRVSSTDQLFDSLKRLRSKWPKGGWSWDNRLSCVASSFGIELVPEAQAALGDSMPNEWNMKNIGSAPPIVREIVESTGGIRPEQLLFSSDPGARIIAYGLWWPWGDDITISLRVGLAGYVAEADNFRFRDLFDALE